MGTAASFKRVEEQLDAAVHRGVFPGAVLLVREGERVFYLRAFGQRSLEPERAPMQEGTIFDLSSLTKPLATSVAMMLLVRDGKIRLRRSSDALLPQLRRLRENAHTFRHLLSHCSGLPAWRPYYKEILQIERTGRQDQFPRQRRGEGVRLPGNQSRACRSTGRATRMMYSDLGFMLLGAVIEEVCGVSLDRFCHERHLPAARACERPRSSISRSCVRGAWSRSPR